MKCAHIEAKFYEEVHDLERKYAALYQPLFDKVGTAPDATPRPSLRQSIHIPPVNRPVLFSKPRDFES